MNPFYHRIYRVVRHIPKGRVATYGLVARLAGRPGAARTVGWALSALPDDTDVPWWRVLNAAGRISLAAHDHGSVVQRALLLPADDRESLLVGFLAELLYLSEVDGIGFDRFELRLDEESLSANLEGANIESLQKGIKAVTYHGLSIRETEAGLEANLVFDV